MKNYDIILKNKLFEGLSKTDFLSMFSCLSCQEKTHYKNDIILHEGERIDFVGIVLKGSLRVKKTDYNGNEIIIAEISEGDMFAEVFACAEISVSPVSVLCVLDCNIIYFDYKKIVSTCSSSCKFHEKLIYNMLKILANKSLYLNRRIDIISKRTLREKILTYLNYESHGLEHFKITLNREELSKFLCADRSALSNELSKMKREGIIDYHKNSFVLYK